jgi:hypothetical protein
MYASFFQHRNSSPILLTSLAFLTRITDGQPIHGEIMAIDLSFLIIPAATAAFITCAICACCLIARARHPEEPEEELATRYHAMV